MHPLRIWTGPVASVKTTRALRASRRVLRLGQDLPFVVRPTKSVRAHEKEHPGFLVTKAGERYPSIEIDSAQEIFKTCAGFGAVWIDEPMLFDDEPSVFKAIMAVRKKMPVLVSGCSATSELRPFGKSLPRLIAVADEVHFCKADCDDCGTLGVATRSICLTGKNEQVLVGGEETYRPVCPTCWSKWNGRTDVSTTLARRR